MLSCYLYMMHSGSDGKRDRERASRRGGRQKSKAVDVLTFTWSVGFRLADGHVRHLDLVHSWRLESWRGEWRKQVHTQSSQDTLSSFLQQWNQPLTYNMWLYALFCGITLTTRLWGWTIQLVAWVANPSPNTYKTNGIGMCILPGATCIFYARLLLFRKRWPKLYLSSPIPVTLPLFYKQCYSINKEAQTPMSWQPCDKRVNQSLSVMTV